MSEDFNVFRGCIPALMTPCREDRKPDFEALVATAQSLVSVGMRGIVYCGSMGDWPLLTDGQRQEGGGYSLKREYLSLLGWVHRIQLLQEPTREKWERQKERTQMAMGTAIALIAIASMCTGSMRNKNRRESDSQQNEKLEQLQSQLNKLDLDLRDRVETLERIVTDRKEDLKRQFDYLDKAS